MLKTMNRAEWHENPLEQRMREALTPTSDPVLMRRLFPLRGKLTKFCKIHQMESGTVLEYMRAKQEPAWHPLEALVPRNGSVYKVSYNSEEVELIPV